MAACIGPALFAGRPPPTNRAWITEISAPLREDASGVLCDQGAALIDEFLIGGLFGGEIGQILELRKRVRKAGIARRLRCKR